MLPQKERSPRGSLDHPGEDGRKNAAIELAEEIGKIHAECAGDAHTEALLLRLASRLAWIPGLDISVTDAVHSMSGGDR